MKNEHLTYYDSTEEKLNIITHAIGLILSIVALVLLVIRANEYGTARHIVSFTIFGASLILLYSASTIYHYSQKPELRHKLNIVDHSAIYILIAGTYTPFTLVTLKGALGWTIFGITWGIALVGIVFKLFYTGRFDKISTAAYVAMGWIIIFAIKPLIENLPINGLYWLMAGGIFYTIGAILFSLRKIPYNHAIFHVFVLFGSFSHFMAVYFYVLV
ncbi:hemolysin III family protein [Aureibaculum sp. 2210JD6-5]|uniref:PAQR family membrane homeostasis protein TrhA n=1 Tax=Aureibaculum sp. 2210JD6-5 TaxID=3103957 RepID=UPI002AADE3C7|nr:hemolysin III family protein [Aureibaculum sp. 2210JD6-5]MDY7396168.1 hemolysin III family protein [Aureibaculum sp. 2210JD6-5]